MSQTTNSGPAPEEMQANTAPEVENPLVLKRLGIEFMVQWDLINKPSKQYLILQKHGEDISESVQFKDWEKDEPDWFSVFANESFQFEKTDAVDVKLAWQEKGEEKSYLIISNVTVQELMDGKFQLFEAEEAQFLESDGI